MSLKCKTIEYFETKFVIFKKIIKIISKTNATEKWIHIHHAEEYT